MYVFDKFEEIGLNKKNNSSFFLHLYEKLVL
jgi:hypothetical protein